MRDTNALRAARAAESDPYRRRFTAAKWTRTVTCIDVPTLFRRLPEFAEWTKRQHAQASSEYAALSIVHDHMWNALVSIARKTYGDHGPLVSGVYRSHFPDVTKDALRTIAHTATRYADMSVAHWRAAGRTIGTWRAMRDDTQLP
jgi:hypothetical protein